MASTWANPQAAISVILSGLCQLMNGLERNDNHRDVGFSGERETSMYPHERITSNNGFKEVDQRIWTNKIGSFLKELLKADNINIGKQFPDTYHAYTICVNYLI